VPRCRQAGLAHGSKVAAAVLEIRALRGALARQLGVEAAAADLGAADRGLA